VAFRFVWQALIAKDKEVQERAEALEQRKADMATRTNQVRFHTFKLWRLLIRLIAFVMDCSLQSAFALICLAMLLADLQNQGDGAWKQGAPLQLNCGGCIIDLKRSTIMVASKSMLARIVSGRWDHVLPRDKAGRIFLDIDEKWIKPIFQHLYHLSLAHDSSEPLDTPENNYQDSDDLMGYYATLDFLGLTETFYPDGIRPIRSAKIPLDVVDPMNFVQNLKPALTCDWRAPWTLLFKSSRDGLDQLTYQETVKNQSNTVVFVNEKSTGNVYGGYISGPRTFPSDSNRIDAAQEPNMFLFAVENNANTHALQHTKFNQIPYSGQNWIDGESYPFHFGDDL
jgi:hypothetical protein